MSIQQIQEEQLLLSQAHVAWRETEAIINPPPVREEIDSLEVSWWRQYGWAFLIVIVSLGLFVAARTGTGIYSVNIAEGFGVWLAFGLTALGLVGIEGLIITFGFFRPRKIETTKLEEFLEKFLFWGSLAIGIVISAASGMKFFMQIAVEIQERWGIAVDRTLSLSLGVGLTFVLFGVTEFAGRLKWLHDNTPRILDFEYRKKMKVWNEQMTKAWKRSAVYLEIMGDKELKRQQIQYDLANANKGRTKVLAAQRQAEIEGILSGSVPNHPANIPNNGNGHRNGPTKTDIIKEYLTECANDGHFPEIQEIQGWLYQSRNMTAAKSTVSDARAAWQKEYDAFRNS